MLRSTNSSFRFPRFVLFDPPDLPRLLLDDEERALAARHRDDPDGMVELHLIPVQRHEADWPRDRRNLARHAREGQGAFRLFQRLEERDEVRELFGLQCLVQSGGHQGRVGPPLLVDLDAWQSHDFAFRVEQLELPVGSTAEYARVDLAVGRRRDDRAIIGVDFRARLQHRPDQLLATILVADGRQIRSRATLVAFEDMALPATDFGRLEQDPASRRTPAAESGSPIRGELIVLVLKAAEPIRRRGEQETAEARREKDSLHRSIPVLPTPRASEASIKRTECLCSNHVIASRSGNEDPSPPRLGDPRCRDQFAGRSAALPPPPREAPRLAPRIDWSASRRITDSVLRSRRTLRSSTR